MEVRSGHILIIDDEAPVLSLLRRVLEPEFEVKTTVQAEQALGWLQEGQRFDAILCDLMMPACDGISFYRRLFQQGASLRSRVLFLTGGASSPEVQTFLAQVPNPRVKKPFRIQDLREAVRKICVSACD
ncbi:MAG: response regulator [Polyangiaceae bacterium]|jgi:CheY-like chemotaxis protein|nr:response regulator [Polyangiaceae bacterium]